MQAIETDYLIVGAGAMGMAFADTMLIETPARMVIVDRHDKPGGHWNDAYPFVTLHQPSAYYGVSSKELSKGRMDETGLNKGLADLATGPEILAYFDEVMRGTFLPSGRVEYFPMCQHEGDGVIRSLLSGETWQVRVSAKTVDATHLKTTVPSTHVPNFKVGEGVVLRPLNDLPRIAHRYRHFTVIGGGKTGIDAVLWLLEHRTPPENIRWIMPRDAWFIDRANTQTTDEFFMATMGSTAAQFEAMAAASSVEDMFDRFERAGVFLRLDPDVRPKMFHGATISQAELDVLRHVKAVVRLGRVEEIGDGMIRLQEGEIPVVPDGLHVDCSASAVGNMVPEPIYQGDRIVLQTVRTVQPVFSAAFIAHIEATRDDDAEKNRLCQVVPLPNHDTDWLRMQAAFMMNQFNWGQEKDLRDWLLANRLDGYSRLVRNVPKEDAERQAVLRRMRDNAMPAMANLQAFIAGL